MHRGPMTAVLSHLRAVAARGTGGPSADAELVARYVGANDGEAFAEIVRRHGPLVWAVCRDRLAPADAEDAFQATFLVLARKAAGIAKRESLACWLSGVARRVVKQAQARASRRAVGALPDELPGRPDAESAEVREERAAVAAAVERLAEKYRLPVLLCYYQGLTNEEAATRLGWPVGTVAGRLARARDQLRRRLDGLASVPPAALVAAASQPATLAGRATVVAIMEATMKAAFWGKVQAVALAGGLVAASATGVGWGLRSAPAQEPKANSRAGKVNDEVWERVSLPDADEPEKNLPKIDFQGMVKQIEALAEPSPLSKPHAADSMSVGVAKILHRTAVNELKDRIKVFATGSRGGSLDALEESIRRVRDTELALGTDPAHQLQTHQRHLQFAAFMLSVNRLRYDAGQVPPQDLNSSRYAYLEALLRTTQAAERAQKGR